MRVLAAVDVHDRGEAVLDQVVPWARLLGARVDLCYASEWSTEGLPRPANPSDELDRIWATWARRAEAEREALVALRDKLPAELRGEARFVAGRAVDVLPDAGAGYDLLVVATHGRTGLQRVLLGSVAARVLRHATVPVMVVGLGDPVPDPGDGLYVLAPVDEKDGGALAWIGRHLPMHRTEMVHVQAGAAPVWVPGPPRTVVVAKAPDTLKTDLAAKATALGFPGIPLHVLDHEVGHIGDAVARCAHELGVDLVVLPTHGRQGLSHAFLGSVAERVAERAPCPVIVVPWSRAGRSEPESRTDGY